MNIYVGNLPFELSEDDLRKAFESYGEVSTVKIVTDRYSGKSRGFAFVEMPDDTQGQEAIDQLNGKDLNGRSLRISKARPRDDRNNRNFR